MVRARTTERGAASATKEPATRAAAAAPAAAAPEATAESLVSVEKCINCRFYDRRHAKPLDGKAPLWGQCRRHAPMLNPITAKAYVVEGIWPLVRDDDWCGEWKIILHAEEWPADPGAEALPPLKSGDRQTEPGRTETALGDD